MIEMPYGVYSGRVEGKSVRVGRSDSDQSYISNKVVLRGNKLVSTYVSGTAATSSSFGGGNTSRLAIGSWEFPAQADSMVGFSIVAPTSIPETAKADIKLLWSTDGSPDSISGVGVVWAVNYMATSVILSGAETATPETTYCLSGALAQSITVGKYYGGTKLLSGAINSTVVPIPSGDFRAGDILNGSIVRSGIEPADTLNDAVFLLYAVVEYR